MQTKDDLFEEAIFNNTVNLIVPMLSVALPRHTSNGDSLTLAYQAAFAIFGLLAAMTYVGVPSSLAIAEAATHFSPNHQRRSRRSTLFPKKYILDKLGLNWDDCLKKTICEAHGRSSEFGILAVPFRILYPLTDTGDEDAYDPFQLAGKLGTVGADCSDCYDCFFDLLDLLKYSIELFTNENRIIHINDV